MFSPRAQRTTAIVAIPTAALLAACSGERNRPTGTPTGTTPSSSTPAQERSPGFGPAQELFGSNTRDDQVQRYPTGMIATGGGSYREDNVVVQDGTLRIKAVQDPRQPMPKDVAADLRDGVDTHKERYFGVVHFPDNDFEYGRVTIEARIPEFDRFQSGDQIGKPVIMLWPENDNDWPHKVEVDFLEATADAARRGEITQWINGGSPSNPDELDPDRPHTSVPMDSDWHTFEVIWKRDSIELKIDGTTTLRSTKPNIVPMGPHRLVIQVDADSIDDIPRQGRHEQTAIEVRKVTLESWLEKTAARDTPSSTVSPTTIPSPDVNEICFTNNKACLVSDGENVFPSIDGVQPARNLAIVAIPPNGGALVKDGNAHSPTGYVLTPLSKLAGRQYTESDISGNGDRWYAIVDLGGRQLSDFFTAEPNGGGVKITPQESSIEPKSIGLR